MDATIRTGTPEGDMWHRYNHDGYGETSGGAPYTGAGVGRLWPIFSGERGEYDLAAGDPAGANAALATMAGAANAGYQIPEQVWDSPSAFGFTLGQGTGSATPLAWSMAQFVRLANNISAGRNTETPAVVAQRYLGGGGPVTETVNVTVPAGTDATARTVYLAGNLSVLGHGAADWASNGVPMTRVDATHWTATVSAAAAITLRYKYTLGDWGSVEKGGSCEELGNRAMSLTGGTENDTVANWSGVPPC